MNDLTPINVTALLADGGAAVDLARTFDQPDTVEAFLKALEESAKAEAFDIATEKGRKACASLAHKIARTKTAWDDAGKQRNDEARKAINAVDAVRRTIRDRLDALKDQVRAPLTAWESAEDEAKKLARTLFDRVTAPVVHLAIEPSETIRHALEAREGFQIDERFRDLREAALTAHAANIEALRGYLAAAEKREAQDREVEALRAKVAAQEAAEKARLEAEAQAKAEAERVERERAEAAARAEREAAEAAAREEQARRREEARQRELAEAAEHAAQAERDRIAAAEKAEAEARAKREADVLHREGIRREIRQALGAYDTLDKLADALMSGAIPHCTVRI